MQKSIAFIVVLVLQFPSLLLADGGTLRLSERSGDFQVSVFTSPVVLRCGAIDISVLVQDAATGKARTDMPVTIRLQPSNERESNQFTDVLQQSATTGAATNKLFRAAVFDVSQPGKWQGSVSLSTGSTDVAGSEHDVEPLVFDMVVSPPPPVWLDLAPWIGWPFAVMALFLIHQQLVSDA